MSNTELAEIVRIVKRQLPPEDEFEVLCALADKNDGAKWNVMVGYLYGLIRGKQIERARRKDNATSKSRETLLKCVRELDSLCAESEATA